MAVGGERRHLERDHIGRQASAAPGEERDELVAVFVVVDQLGAACRRPLCETFRPGR